MDKCSTVASYAMLKPKDIGISKFTKRKNTEPLTSKTITCTWNWRELSLKMYYMSVGKDANSFLNYDFDDVGENNSYLDTNEDDGNESNIDPSELLDQKNVLEEDGSEEDGDEAEEIADNKTGSSTDSVNNIGISQQPEEMLSIIDNEDLKHKSIVYL